MITDSLQDEASRYMKKIEVEREKIKDLDEQIIKYQELILDQKTRLGGINAAQINNQLIQKQIKVLDNRLDKCLLKFNETVAHNRSLRHKIDEYRRERIVFDGIYKKLERDLHEKKKEMTAIIEDSKNAYQLRDKSQSEMAALQQHAEKERADFEKDFKELSDSIKQQQLFLEQQRLKQFERSNEDTMGHANLATEQQAVERNTSMVNWGIGNKERPIPQDKIQSYEDMMLKIQESTGLTDVQEIINKFLEAEEQNFSLFNYVNDINTEIERLEHSISNMRSQIEKYRGQGVSSDTMRKKTVRDLEEKVNKTDKKASEYDARYQVAARTITQLKNGIQSIFTRIGANSSSIVDEIMSNQGVTESNMMQYLGIIEQKTTEILQQYASSQMGLPSEALLQLPTVIPMEGGGKLVPAQIPSFADADKDFESDKEDSDAEIDERPLTRQELDKIAKKEYNRKGGLLTPNTNANNRIE